VGSFKITAKLRAKRKKKLTYMKVYKVGKPDRTLEQFDSGYIPKRTVKYEEYLNEDIPKVVLEHGLGKIILLQGDAFKVLEELDDEQFDLILTDPPYDVVFKGITRLTHVQKSIVIQHFKRLLKPTGNIVMWCNDEMMFVLDRIMSNYDLKFVQAFAWVYRNPSGHPPKRKFHYAKENALWYAKTLKRYYFGKPKDIQYLNWTDEPAYGGVARARDGVPIEKLGVTPKPLKFSYKLVRALCPKGGVVLDCFMGLGTFAIPCINYCTFVGVELREDVFRYCVERVKKFMTHRIDRWC